MTITETSEHVNQSRGSTEDSVEKKDTSESLILRVAVPAFAVMLKKGPKRKFTVPIRTGQDQGEAAENGLRTAKVLSQSIPTETPEAKSLQMTVLFAKKGPKKRKHFSDGLLVIEGNKVKLMDESRTDVTASWCNQKLRTQITTQDEFELGGFEIQVAARDEAPRPVPLQQPLTLHRKVAPPRPLLPTTSTSKPQETSKPLLQSRVTKKRRRPGLIVDPLSDDFRSDPGIRTLKSILKPHQTQAVQFLWRCVAQESSGAILADDMGLGKTLSSIALCYCAVFHNLSKKIIIVCPSSLVDTWNNEFTKWLPFTLSSRAQSPNRKVSVLRNGAENDFCTFATPILIASYETFRKRGPAITSALDSDESSNLLICDEAHRLKGGDGSKTMEALLSFRTSRRILLTGTPLQNNLSELHAMVSFARPQAFPSLNSFRKATASVIERSRDRDASTIEQGLGLDAMRELRSVLDHFVLRRSRDEIDQLLPPRTDYVLFCPLTSTQRTVYCQKSTITSDPLSTIHELRMICNHPSLLSRVQSESVSELNGGKTRVLMALLDAIRRNDRNERVVLVSNFTSTLDLLEQYISARKWTFVRLDGSTQVADRQPLVDRLNRRSAADDLFVFLLSSHAGGAGLTLTGASRLILFDPDWNPAIDNQVMARVWREGQTREVAIYRMLSTGTIEERMFQRQLFKGELSSVVQAGPGIDGGNFRQDELRELFDYNEATVCETHERLAGKWFDSQPVGNLKDKALRDAIQKTESWVSYIRET